MNTITTMADVTSYLAMMLIPGADAQERADRMTATAHRNPGITVATDQGAVIYHGLGAWEVSHVSG